MRAVSTPKPCCAAKASPEIFSRMRLNTGVGIYEFSVLSSQLSAELSQHCHPERSENIREADVLAKSKDPCTTGIGTDATRHSPCAARSELPAPYLSWP